MMLHINWFDTENTYGGSRLGHTSWGKSIMMGIPQKCDRIVDAHFEMKYRHVCKHSLNLSDYHEMHASVYSQGRVYWVLVAVSCLYVTYWAVHRLHWWHKTLKYTIAYE